MRPCILVLAVLGIAGCDNAKPGADDNENTAAPLAIPADAEGRPTSVEPSERNQTAVVWRESIDKARARFESLKASAAENGQAIEQSTDRLIQKTKDAINEAEDRLGGGDQVAADEFEGFKAMMDRDLAAIEADLKELDDSISTTKDARASREIEEDHE